MLHYALVFLVIAILAAIFGFGMAATAFTVFPVFGRLRRKPCHAHDSACLAILHRFCW